MKRIITLALAAGLIVAASAPAKAADVSISGYLFSTSQYFDDMNFSEAGANGMNLGSRIELVTKAVVSENLWGQIKFRVPSTSYWGATGDNNMSAGTWGTTVKPSLRDAFVDFTLPMAPVSIRAGYQYLELPAYMGATDPILANIAPAVVVSTDFGMIQPTFVYARLSDSTGSVYVDSTESDMLAVVVPVAMDMFTVTPWVAFADDMNSTQQNAFWVGATSSINMMDNLNFGVDLLYSSLNRTGDNLTGYLFDAYATYSMDFATIGAFGWYASGASKDGKSGLTMIDGDWGAFAGNGSIFFDQAPATWGGAIVGNGPAGTMGFAASIANIAVVDNMKMGAHVMYVASTSELTTGATGLNHEDYSLVELGANASYKIYDELTAGVNLYYLVPMDDVAGKDNAFTGGVTLKYTF